MPRSRSMILAALSVSLFGCAAADSSSDPTVAVAPATTDPADAGSAAQEPVPSADAGPADAAAALPDPVVFVHGVKGSSADFKVMIDRLVSDGWPRERLVALDFADPQWGCNADNAVTIKTNVDLLRAKTGAARVDLVAHSMGSLSSRRYVRDLGGKDAVATYVTLGGMHHGLDSSCLNPLPVCTWEELCGTKPYLVALNTAPVTPGPAKWVSIFSKTDETVPAASAHLDGAENIELDGIDHSGKSGLLERPEAYAQVKRVLTHPTP